ncbi:phage Gp37/Gp68 family protein [Thalassospira aquimaris]|uniref:Phage Gp37/Gp68 family protein n=1 Tax=Thalassospira aquimaris TaxID=3037796 RepID=A0ABT6GC04_9PROT|nr:phage Gp37/Gp68 family protein [Thalassospira sp. FZY0004]MDG4719387.1 phage Gp37/Gp68 family protein [Thalassospira sp. FZY0004]
MTKIEWTQRPGTKGETWNPIRARNKETGGIGHFCTKVSAGCQNCYAANFQKRFKNKVRYAAQDANKVELFLDETVLMQPLHWKKPRTIFVCSMTDLFYEGHDDEWIDSVFAIAALCPQHTFIILTKRIKTAHQYMTSIDNGDGERLDLSRDPMVEGAAQRIHHFRTGEDPSMWLAVHLPLPNVWLGVSVEDQKAADERIPVLLDTPAAVRFLSVEPLLGPVNLKRWLGRRFECPECGFDDQEHGTGIYGSQRFCGICAGDCGNSTKLHVKGRGLDWVIVGGESGHNARPMHPDWARSLRDQCKAAEVPFFFKQNGSWISAKPGDKFSDGLWVHQNGDTFSPVEGQPFNPAPFAAHMIRVGKKRAGRSLDGVEHNEWPEVKSC